LVILRFPRAMIEVVLGRVRSLLQVVKRERHLPAGVLIRRPVKSGLQIDEWKHEAVEKGDNAIWVDLLQPHIVEVTQCTADA